MTPNLTPTQTAPRQHADAAQIPADRLKAFIETRLRGREEPARIAAAVQAYFDVALDGDQVVPYWRGEIALPTQTEHRQDKESAQLPADAPTEPNFTRMADDETPHRVFEVAAQKPFSIKDIPDPVSAGADGSDAPATQTGRRRNAESRQGGTAADDAPATQTGRRQNAKSLQDADLHFPADPVDEPHVTREAREAAIGALAALARARIGIPPDPADNADGAPAEDEATQTGRRPDQKTKSVLTDEMKAFIVHGLARYETPTRVAASLQAQFGIAIDRRQVYAYDPAGSRPPAQRWIDLHAATRAKFLAAAAEIGVAQKVVRLRMLDRFANRADELNQIARGAKLLEQAAKECGGFYERYARA